MLLLHVAGSDCKNHEDEKEADECCTTDRAGGNLKEHVPTVQKNDQRADRVAYRTQVHEARRG